MTSELHDLCDAAIEDRLTPEQAARLDELVLSDPAARRYVVEALYQHAALTWAAADPRVLNREGEAPAEPARQEPRPPGARNPGRLVKWAGWVVAFSLLIALGAGFLARRGEPREFAQLAELRACKWEGGSLPTEQGARLGAGRLRLAEGVARIVFDNGAELRLEGPADLELVGKDKCVLYAGRLVARVPEPAHGFIVDTPSAVLKDLGTEFGVSVADGKTADVQVFDGRVDVTHRGTGRVEAMRTGRSLRFAPDAVTDLGPGETPPPLSADTQFPDGRRVVIITTAMGAGKDAYIQPVRTTKHQSDILILVKRHPSDASEYNRKGYVGFDLSPVAGRRVHDAQLSFTLAPTGMGFASEVPDATFTVYGLTDESLDNWDEKAIPWDTAPANGMGGNGVDPAKTVSIGRFGVAQGVSHGVRSVSGPALVDFLNRSTNRTVTFILVRETPGSGRNDLVHGFANKYHPTLPPPTLKLTVEGK
jgi:ferric-dicitrate binding protein FerR (iron transport regulator)